MDSLKDPTTTGCVDAEGQASLLRQGGDKTTAEGAARAPVLTLLHIEGLGNGGPHQGSTPLPLSAAAMALARMGIAHSGNPGALLHSCVGTV